MARLRIAKAGFNVGSDKRNLSLDTDYGNVMIVSEASIAGTASQYTHGLGYLPTTLEFFKYGSFYYPMGADPVDVTQEPFGWYIGDWTPELEYDTNKIYITNTDQMALKIFITGNSADDTTGSGKNTASGKIRVAKDGLNVPDITDVRQFKFCSGLDTLKRDSILSGSISVAYENHEEVTHNLGYHPIVIAKASSGQLLPFNAGAFDLSPIGFYTTTTKIVFYNYGAGSSETISYNVYRNKIE